MILQLALNVQLEQTKGGLKGECIYIDTEGSLVTQRLIKMIQSRANGGTVESILKKIHVFRVLDHTELVAIVRQLPMIIKANPNVKLIILDSIAFHVRLNIRNSNIRSNLLQLISQTLMKVADQNQLAEQGIEQPDDEESSHDHLETTQSTVDVQGVGPSEELMHWNLFEDNVDAWDQPETIHEETPVTSLDNHTSVSVIQEHGSREECIKRNSERNNITEAISDTGMEHTPIVEMKNKECKVKDAHSIKFDHVDDPSPSDEDYENFPWEASSYSMEDIKVIPDSQPSSPSNVTMEEGEWSIPSVSTGKRKRDDHMFQICGSDEDEPWLQFADIDSP
ncbi:DNA repair protein rad51c [Apophysomyces ossiformis]|uniref:DNA repair protein RAD51 homolog 3 n=1 Tax=Apophysomyces ossiformis TaxID=679940 RepID=A0A8H7EUU8_9FUNG|nr:DNA repair protein rad51c [Apophysomyces ossiformis]